ncbi:alpha-glucosidase-like [Mizuhopecten yessoensis]|uniref:Maltase 1 n=1 Tax=Mizuhopecten yessoensis TaxID=6573 RepID=A0A210QEE0_MIZYE|nr:alpha-glucosidase-like [Mizuhopecten yessoensis]OWF47094.1 Maltase 1 [Mizuhopecten yessoensis]
MDENGGLKKREHVCSKTRCSVFIAFLVASCVVVLCVVTFEVDDLRMKIQYDVSGLAWWKTSIIYQVYPRSFKDSNGDGVGDLRGITQKLDYLADLGIGAIWISPFYTSPMRDFGYDISNYTQVDPTFGTMDDFDNLLKEARKRGLKIIVDFVPNHTSNESMWFQESRKGPNNSYSDYYVWKDGVILPNGSRGPPNNWLSVFGGSAWTFDPERGQYYYHAFLKSQADINFYSPHVLQELKTVLRFWLDRGVSGFRLDALKFLFESKDVTLNEALLPNQFEWNDDGPHNLTTSFPQINDVIKDWRSLLDEYTSYDKEPRFMAEESYGLTAEMRNAHYKSGAMPFNFALLNMNSTCGGTCVMRLINKGLHELADDAWPNFQVGNHDNSRVASRVGVARSGAVTMLLLTLPGTPTSYYGDEIGMQDVFYTFQETRDPAGIHFGKDGYEGRSRDPERSPMQWSGTTNAGFSSGTPWLHVHENFTKTNVKDQNSDTVSMLNLYRTLAKIRKYPSFQNSQLQYAVTNDNVVSYVRMALGWTKYLVLINFGPSTSTDDYSKSPVDSTSGIIVATTNNFNLGDFRTGQTISLVNVRLHPGQGLVVTVYYQGR